MAPRLLGRVRGEARRLVKLARREKRGKVLAFGPRLGRAAVVARRVAEGVAGRAAACRGVS